MEHRRKIILATVFVGLVLLINMTFANVGEKSVLPEEKDQIDEPKYLNFQDYVVVQSEDGELLLVPQEDMRENLEGDQRLTSNEGMDRIAIESFEPRVSRSSPTPFIDNQDPDVIDRFSSYEDLKSYMENHTTGHNNYYNWRTVTTGSRVTEGTALGHSETNVQEEGVDEGDVVKVHDGYVYIVSRDGFRVFIVDVNSPEDAKIVSTIYAKGSISEIYVKDSILVIIGQRDVFQIDPSPVIIKNSYEYFRYRGMKVTLDVGNYYYLNFLNYPATFIDMYDISDGMDPSLVTSHVIKGIPLETRMIGNYVYVITSYYLNRNFQEYDLPVKASDIHYFNPSNDTDPNNYFLQLTTIMSIDISSPSEFVDVRALLMPASDVIYVSLNNIYITYNEYDYLMNTYKTYIHRITIDFGEILYGTHNEIEGRVLNRFSMDEYGNYFRIAVSLGWSTSHSIYVLDMDLKIVGELEGIAPNERLCSARFAKYRLYLVTFWRSDPFFTIDLTDPAQPRLLGELVIPGWSDYLHPYDEHHVIGLGSETDDAGRRVGVKLSLFNVTDFENPTEISKLIIGDGNSRTIAASEPHAFLLSKELNIIVIPVRINYTENHAYIINISMEHGFELRGTVGHPRYENDPNGDRWYYNSAHHIKRSFYIDNALFTLSDSFLQSNDLNDLSHIYRVKLPNEPQITWENQFMCLYIEPFLP